MGQRAVQPRPAGKLRISSHAGHIGLRLHPRCRLHADVGRLFVDSQPGAADLARAVDARELGYVLRCGQPARQVRIHRGQRLSQLLLGLGSGRSGDEQPAAAVRLQARAARRHVHPAAAQACRIFGAAYV